MIIIITFTDSCSSLNLYGNGTENLNASIQCLGYRSCNSMNLYVVKSPQLYINCDSAYSCQSTKIYSSNAGWYTSFKSSSKLKFKFTITHISPILYIYI